MASKTEPDLDAALAALDRELRAAGPQPSPDLSAMVLADAALTALARDVHAAAPQPAPALVRGVAVDAALIAVAARVRAAAPQPDDALVARVLADAAAVAAERPVPSPAQPRVAKMKSTRRGRMSAWFVGWAGGAVAAMTLGLAAGLGLGLEAGPDSLPLFTAAEVDPMALAEAGPDLLLLEGL